MNDHHQHSRQLWPGVPFALGSAALFGISTPLAKLFIGAIDPWLLAGLLYLGSGCGLLIYQLALPLIGKSRTEAPLQGSDVKWMALIVLSGGVVGPVLLMLGLSRISASAASLLLNLEGLATMGIAWLVFKENVDRRLLTGAFAILAGAVIVSWQGSISGADGGFLLVAGACLSWGIDNNLTRKLSASDPLQIVTIKGLAAGTVNIFLALGQGATLPPASIALTASVMGLFGYGVSIVLFVLGLRHLGTARCGAYFSTAPFIGAALSVPLFHDPVTAKLLLSGGLMAFGVWLHVTEKHEHWHEHEEMTHEHSHVHDEHHQHEHGPNDPAGEPHVHAHTHKPLRHRHAHYPDLHHRHKHGS
jgi:drug/metabolite transporter (DMT)-like permease